MLIEGVWVLSSLVALCTSVHKNGEDEYKKIEDRNKIELEVTSELA